MPTNQTPASQTPANPTPTGRGRANPTPTDQRPADRAPTEPPGQPAAAPGDVAGPDGGTGETRGGRRSSGWFADPDHPDSSAQHLERYLASGLTLGELRGGRPVIGIAQTGSDLTPCNRHHVELARRVRDGIRDAGGVALEFPVHPIQESGRRPTAALDRNLAYLGLVEVLHGYPLDGVVLTTGCDKTTPACLMAAATVDIPAIVLSGGPMLNGWLDGRRVGSGTIIWKARELLAAGEIDADGFVELVAQGSPSAGHCNTMGTAMTMNAIAEALGVSLPGCAAVPAVHRDRAQLAYLTGRRIVEMVAEDLRPSRILTREAFANAIVLTSAIGGSSNAPIHLTAIARHAGVDVGLADWQEIGFRVPLLVNLQPVGEYLGEDFHRAGGVAAVLGELAAAGLVNTDCLTINGRTVGENCAGRRSLDHRVIRPVANPLATDAGFLVLGGNLFDHAVMKTSAITEEFRERYLSDPAHPNCFDGRVVVFDGPEDYRARIDDPALGVDEHTILVMRGVGPLGYPGSAEVVNMRPPAALIRAGISGLPCIGDGRQSGTSGSPSILNASPEAAAGGNLALLRTGDVVRVDLGRRRVDVLLDDAELARRRRAERNGYPVPEAQTPWQEIQRGLVSQLSDGMVLRPATRYRRAAVAHPVPRDSH
ncbi:MAG: dihydroxy-acid dehydratase family protein [Frankia sp.]|nr:dihydroxy-acid dehydratase family protein [Frankia sp.]